MTNTAKKLTILSANLNFYMSNKVQKKTSEKIVKMLLSEEQNPKPTFIALQEVGNRVIYKVEKDEIEDYSVNIERIENKPFNEGYGVIRPKQYGKEKDASNPVNTRLFYLKKSVESIKELTPLGLGIKEDFYNRQCGGIFTINNQTIAVYSLHFKWQKDERGAFWKKYIEIAESNKYNHLILAGDFNESLINVTTELSDKITKMKNYMVDASHDLPTWKDKQLDHIFITPNTKIENYSTLDNDFSDHKALQVTIIV
ncbi:TPA: endonuclease [Streptococcus pneumoniae]|nr:endonuclease [Streptococcus pneumoniae]